MALLSVPQYKILGSFQHRIFSFHVQFIISRLQKFQEKTYEYIYNSMIGGVQIF